MCPQVPQKWFLLAATGLDRSSYSDEMSCYGKLRRILESGWDSEIVNSKPEERVPCGKERLAEITKIAVIIVNMAGSQDLQVVFVGEVGIARLDSVIRLEYRHLCAASVNGARRFSPPIPTMWILRIELNAPHPA